MTSSSCASVDERCLDGLLPPRRRRAGDPYGAKPTPCEEGAAAAASATGVRGILMRRLRRRVPEADAARTPGGRWCSTSVPDAGGSSSRPSSIAAAANAITYLAADDDAADHRAARAAADALALQDAHDDAALLPDLGLDPREAPPPLNDDEKPIMVVAGGGNSPQRVATPPPSLSDVRRLVPATERGRRQSAAANAALAALGVASVSPEGANGHFPQPKPQAAPQKPAQPCLPDADAKRLFALFDHARYCPGCHKSKKHDDVCTAAKFVMLHVRDCAGHLPDGRPCPFGWCSAARLAIPEAPPPADPGQVRITEVRGTASRRR